MVFKHYETLWILFYVSKLSDAEIEQTKPKQMKHHNVYENCISSNRKNLANDMRIYYTVEL